MRQARCGCCAERRGIRKDFRNGAVEVDDFYDGPKYRKPGGKRNKNKACKKSKTNEKCDYSVKIVTRQFYSKVNEYWVCYTVMTCSRCGKHGSWGHEYKRELPYEV